MNEGQIVTLVIVLVLCLISGIADSQGFIHASRVWQNDQLVWRELGWSALGFAVGIGHFWTSLRFMKRLGIVSPEVQTALWFTVTIIGVAITSGKFSKWPLPDQVIACLVVSGLGWLLIRSSQTA